MIIRKSRTGPCRVSRAASQFRRQNRLTTRTTTRTTTRITARISARISARIMKARGMTVRPAACRSAPRRAAAGQPCPGHATGRRGGGAFGTVSEEGVHCPHLSHYPGRCPVIRIGADRLFTSNSAPPPAPAPARDGGCGSPSGALRVGRRSQQAACVLRAADNVSGNNDSDNDWDDDSHNDSDCSSSGAERRRPHCQRQEVSPSFQPMGLAMPARVIMTRIIMTWTVVPRNGDLRPRGQARGALLGRGGSRHRDSDPPATDLHPSHIPVVVKLVPSGSDPSRRLGYDSGGRQRARPARRVPAKAWRGVTPATATRTGSGRTPTDRQ